VAAVGEQGQSGDDAGGEHDDAVCVVELYQTAAERGGKDSESGEKYLCRKKPAKELPEVFAADLVKEKTEWNRNGAVDVPIQIGPERWRLVEKRAKEPRANQQADSIENAEQAEVNQREVSGFTAKEEKSHGDKGYGQKSDSGGDVEEFPTQI
jgi:hypothetical protein